MKKVASFLMAAVLACLFPIAAYAQTGGQAVYTTLEQPDFDAYSDAYAVIDAQTGQVLVEKNMNKREYPASITKVLTIALAMEKADLDDKLTVSEQAVYSIPYNSSHIALSPGEVISLRDAVFGALLPSANDAANVMAENVGGSIEMFAAMMNAKAAEAGALNTHFVNVNGLEDDDHYTTAYDMAMITRYALTVRGFREVFGTVEYTMAPTNLQPEVRNFGTAHHMIVYSAYQYDGAWGGKLGWTAQANHTAVTVAKRDDIELICVVMNSKNKWEKYQDSSRLFDYCFDNLEKVTVTAGPKKSAAIPIIEEKSVVGVVDIRRNEESYELLVPKGVTAGDIDSSLTTRVSYQKGELIEPKIVFSYKNDDAAEAAFYCTPLACEVVLDESGSRMETAVAGETMVYSTQGEEPPAFQQRVFLAVAITLLSIAVLLMLFLIVRASVRSWYRHKRRKLLPGRRRY